MLSFFYVVLALAAVFGMSLLIERFLRRSRKEFRRLGAALVFFPLFFLGAALVYMRLDVYSPFIYAAYGLAGGLAALVAQMTFGVRLACN
jgi:hypothetical protein